MANLGDDLRQERERRGVSIEQIAASTKVSLRHLRALESDRFDQLPGGVFNKGILRSYLHFLELDEQAWIDRFSQTSGSAAPAAGEENEWLRYAHTVTGIAPSPRGSDDVRFRWLGVAILFVLLAVGGWLTWRFAAKHWHHGAPSAPTAQSRLLYSGHAVAPLRDAETAPPHQL